MPSVKSRLDDLGDMGEHAVLPNTLNLSEVWSILVMERGNEVRSRVAVSDTCFLIAHGFRTHGLHVMKPLKGLRILH
jgi:hypothetical protein